MNMEICEAIEKRNIIRFYYNGGIRIVEPFCYGIHRNTGNGVLRAYQIDGSSKSGKMKGWEPFEVIKISEIEVTGNQFQGNRIECNPNDSHMSKVFCCL